jgi:hypothetical protein
MMDTSCTHVLDERIENDRSRTVLDHSVATLRIVR